MGLRGVRLVKRSAGQGARFRATAFARPLPRDRFRAAVVFAACLTAWGLAPGMAAGQGHAIDGNKATVTYRFDRMWPTLQQPWYFKNPVGLATDSTGAIYITDGGYNRIRKLTADGQLVAQWGSKGSEPGELWFPTGIDVDDAGFVYVADTANNRIEKFTNQGAFVTQWGQPGSGPGQFNAPFGVAVDAIGRVYVADSNNNRIQIFDSEGAFLDVWAAANGLEGSGPGEFIGPSDVAIAPDGSVYVADTYNFRVQKFKSDGEYVREWGSYGDGAGEFMCPSGIVVSRAGSVFVTDWASFMEPGANDRVEKFSPDGAFLGEWGTFGFGLGSFNGPWGIAADPTGAVYVAEYNNNRIQKFTSRGWFLSAWGSSGSAPGQFLSPMGAAVDDANGWVYVADFGNDRIQKFDLDGALVGGWGSYGTGTGQFFGPSGVAADASGNVYVVDALNDRVQKFDSSGAWQTQWGGSGTAPGDFNLPWGIAVCDPGGKAGVVFVADELNCRIQRFTLAGGNDGMWGSEGAGSSQFKKPRGVAVDGSGFVYVADSENNRVQKFTINGTYVTQWGEAGFGPGQFVMPIGIAASASGEVFVADTGCDRVQKFSSGGEFLAEWGTSGGGPGHFNYPSAVAVSTTGAAYVVDWDNNSVQKFDAVTVADNNRAIVVAAGGPFPGNNLWDATQMCANLAYLTLTYRGFTKDSIWYLSSNASLDLDGNGMADDVDGDATKPALESAITTWASGADDLVVYLVNHGGDRTFRLNDTEILGADELAGWLNATKAGVSGTTVVVYDACQSGSFVSALTAANRITITGAASGESAYFLSTGTVSFSSFFWTQVFTGLSVGAAFTSSRDAVSAAIGFQTPQLADPGHLAPATFIGSGGAISGEGPTIGGVSPAQFISATSTATLWAYPVTDDDGVARVWAVFRPPGYEPPSADNPVTGLPSVELWPTTTANRFEAAYDKFTTVGAYPIAIYAKDARGNTSLPTLTTVTVSSPLRRRAVIVAGGPQSSPLWTATASNAALAYECLKFQGYTGDDINYLSPATGTPGVDSATTSANLQSALTSWAAANTQDLLLYLIGSGSTGSFTLSATQTLSAATLEGWLATLQAAIPGTVVVVYDASRSGSFVPLLTPPAGKTRIVISSTDAHESANFLVDGRISFSQFFWLRVLNGANLRTAFGHASNAVGFAAGGQSPQLDDTGDGVYDTKSDGRVAMNYTIGAGIMLAGDDPLIGSISPRELIEGTTSAVIWVDGVTTTGAIDTVWAVITPPGRGKAGSDKASVSLELLPAAGRFQATYSAFSQTGAYAIAVYAVDTEGNVSLPQETKVGVGPYAFADVNEDGVPDALDVQLVINAALGLSADPNADVNADGAADALDVQLVINAVLGV